MSVSVGYACWHSFCGSHPRRVGPSAINRDPSLLGAIIAEGDGLKPSHQNHQVNTIETKAFNRGTMANRRWILGGGAVAGLVGLGLVLVWGGPPGGQPGAGPDADTLPEEPALTLRDVTLEQPDDAGNLLWRVRGEEVAYSPDQKVAFITAPNGDLYDAGDAVYFVEAEQGQIRDNGQSIVLTGNVVATGVQNGAVLRGDELEWQPDTGTLVMRGNLTGTHPQIRITAQEVRVFNRERYMLLDGEVEADTVVADPTVEPWLNLQTDSLYWFWAIERLDTDTPLQIEQRQNEAILNVLNGDSGQVDLAPQVATVEQNVVMNLVEFPLEVVGERAVWEVAAEQVTMDQPLQVTHPDQQVVVTAQTGQLNLATDAVLLEGQVDAQAQRNQGRLTTDQLTWTLPNDTMVAEGNVNYRQVDPAVVLTGPQAVVQLEAQTLVVSGGRVVTQIVPDLGPNE